MSSNSQQNSLSFSSSSSSQLPITPSLSLNPSCLQKISLCQSFLNSLIANPIYHPFLSFNQFSYGLFDYSYIVGWRNNGSRYARYDNGQFENGLIGKMEEIKGRLEGKIEERDGKLGKGEGNDERKEKSVDEKVKKRGKKKSFNFEVFISNLKKIFIEVSDYLLLDDPLQQVCSNGLSQIKNFQKSYKNHLHLKKSLSSPSPSPSLYARYSNPVNQIAQDSQQTHSHSHPHSHSLPFRSDSFRPPRSFSHTFKEQLEFAFYLKNYEHDEQMLMEIGKVCGILREQKPNGNDKSEEGEFLLCFGDSDSWKALIRRQWQ